MRFFLHPSVPGIAWLGFPLRWMSSLPALEVTGAGSQEHIVGVPVKAEDGGADGFFDVFAHPPTHMGEKGRQVTGQQCPEGTTASALECLLLALMYWVPFEARTCRHQLQTVWFCG